MVVGVTHVDYIKDYQLKIKFDNGVSKIIDLSNYLKGEIFEPLKNLEYFKQVKVDKEIDTICWSNGADYASEFLYENGVEI